MATILENVSIEAKQTVKDIPVELLPTFVATGEKKQYYLLQLIGECHVVGALAKVVVRRKGASAVVVKEFDAAVIGQLTVIDLGLPSADSPSEGLPLGEGNGLEVLTTIADASIDWTGVGYKGP